MRSFGFIFVFVLAVTEGKKDFSGDQVVSIYPKTNAQVNVIQKLEETHGLVDFWSPESGENVRIGSSVDILFPKQHLNKLKHLMDENEIEYKIKIQDVQQLMDNQVKGRNNARTSLTHNYNVYHPLEEIYKWTEDIAAEYPHLVSRSWLGESYEGNDIDMLTISTNSANPAILIDCGFHAREWISPAFCQCLTRNLLESYGKDPAITHHLNSLTYYIIPLINVDGYNHTWTENRLWRKTRSNYGTACYGVDPNRNSDANFGGVGSSGNPCSETYRGPALESEKEVEAFAKFVRANADNIMVYLSFHSYSQLIVLPFSYTLEETPTLPNLMKYAAQAANAVEGVFGTEYIYGQGSHVLYEVSGGSKDFAYLQGIPFTCTFELRDTGEYGFLLPEDQIEPTCIETTAAVRSFSDAALEMWHNRK